jgi:hypothetical protein
MPWLLGRRAGSTRAQPPGERVLAPEAPAVPRGEVRRHASEVAAREREVLRVSSGVVKHQVGLGPHVDRRGGIDRDGVRTAFTQAGEPGGGERPRIGERTGADQALGLEQEPDRGPSISAGSLESAEGEGGQRRHLARADLAR